jgi:FkbM family methyltransferase
MDYLYYLRALVKGDALRKLYLTEVKAACYYNNLVKPEYSWLDEQLRPNTTLLDIGAYIGDTALYFARNPNVKRILSYEPIPTFFGEARKAIAQNPYRAKIHLFNSGVAAEATVRRISPGRMGMPSFERLDDAGGVEVRSVTLPSILNGLKNVAMKMDIEGEEHKILTRGMVLDNIYAIQLEYHGGIGSLVEVLRAKKFRVTHSAEPTDRSRGIICALKR